MLIQGGSSSADKLLPTWLTIQQDNLLKHLISSSLCCHMDKQGFFLKGLILASKKRQLAWEKCKKN